MDCNIIFRGQKKTPVSVWSANLDTSRGFSESMAIISKTSSSAIDCTSLAFIFEKNNSQINTIPTPTKIWLLKGHGGTILVAYDIWGDLTTKRSSAYLNDVKKRYNQTYHCKSSEILPFTVPDVDNGRRYDLKEISKGLETLKARASTFSETKRIYTGKEDSLFWTAKEFCEMTIRRKQDFTEFDIKQIILAAGGTYSEAKAKAKSIYSWYKMRNFKGSSRVHEMTRVENAKKQARELAKRTREKVRTVAVTFVNLNQKITAKAVGEAAQVDQRTAGKYLKEMKSEGLI